MDVNGTGAGHRITMISNVAKYISILRDQDHFIRQLRITSSRDYDLIFVCFAKILRMRNMAIFCIRQPSGETLRMLVCKCVIFMLAFVLDLGFSI